MNRYFISTCNPLYTYSYSYVLWEDVHEGRNHYYLAYLPHTESWLRCIGLAGNSPGIFKVHTNFNIETTTREDSVEILKKLLLVEKLRR
jgi:hypothetical protein